MLLKGVEPVALGGGIEGPVVDDGSGGGDWVVVAIKSNDGHYRLARSATKGVIMRAEWMCHVAIAMCRVSPLLMAAGAGNRFANIDGI